MNNQTDKLILYLLILLYLLTMITAFFADKEIDAANKTIEYLISEQEDNLYRINALIEINKAQDERLKEIENDNANQGNRINANSSTLAILRLDINTRFADMLNEVNSFETAVNDLTPSQIILPTTWTGSRLSRSSGVCNGPSGRETYYNMDMSFCISRMRSRGYSEKEYPYYIRDDGCKMLGPYIMVAANFKIRPLGTIVETSLGWGIVVDTGGFTRSYPRGLDIAVNW